MNKLSLSISVVIYKESFNEIKACLQSLITFMPRDIDYQIIIIDNGAEQKNDAYNIELHCANHFQGQPILYILSPKNGGYGYGHNQAIFLSQANYHLIINGDVIVMPETLKKALEFMQENPSVGMLVPDIYDTDGNRVYLCRQNPKLWISFLRRFASIWLKKCFVKQLNKFEMREKNYDQPLFNLTNPTGCFMFCRLPIVKMINGFDEKFFLYYEDSDLGRRLTKLSKIAYVPSVKITHAWKRGAYHDRRLSYIAIKSAFYYAWKWYRTG